MLNITLAKQRYLLQYFELYFPVRLCINTTDSRSYAYLTNVWLHEM